MHIGQFLNGLAGPVSAVPPVLSVKWFPVKERVTATSLASMSGYLGMSIAFVIGDVVFSVDSGAFLHAIIINIRKL